MKTIKINLFDIDQAVDIIDDSIIKINDNKTDKFINLFEVSSIESFQYNHRYNTETYILLMMSSLSLPIMFQIKHYGATGSMLFIIFFNFIALGFALYHYNALEQRQNYVCTRLIIKTRDNITYVIKHYTDANRSYYMSDYYKQGIDFNKTKNTLLKLHEQVISAKAKIYKYEK